MTSCLPEAFREGDYAPSLSVVEDGEQALQFLKRRGGYKNAPRPDLILLDLNLPKKKMAGNSSQT